ncbi:uncharacterized protein LOC126045023 [Accipiter gentilis]|uniref:uncharacterized protein LOC126045023 n=1 Tax=Astur gentilis TaxID=8957 RepID=UPI00210F6993|nr:uncharacterized protein LOC126045023 [Accipiter gentilis]
MGREERISQGTAQHLPPSLTQPRAFERVHVPGAADRGRRREGTRRSGTPRRERRLHRCSSAGVPSPLEHRHPRTRLSGQRFGHRSRRAGRLPLPRRARLPSAPPPLFLFPKPPPGAEAAPGTGVRPPARARDGGASGQGPPRRVLPCPEVSRGLGAVSEVPFGGADAVLVRFVWSPCNASAAGFAEATDCKTAPGYPRFQPRTGQDGLGCTGGAFPGHRDTVLAPKPTDWMGDRQTVSRSWGSPKRGCREERLVTALILLQVSAVTLKNAFCCFLQKPKSCSWFPAGPELGGIASLVLLRASRAGTRTGAAVLQVTQTRTAFLPKQSVLLCRVPLRALSVHVPDPTASQPLGFCREPTSDCRQTQRCLLAEMFPGCRSCRRHAACALAAPQSSAACRA